MPSDIPKMKSIIQVLIFCCLFLNLTGTSLANDNLVEVSEGPDGWVLLVEGDSAMVKGMNWDYFPVGTNYEYVVWDESDEIIRKALDYEMGLLKEIGVNAIRVYTGVPARWIQNKPAEMLAGSNRNLQS